MINVGIVFTEKLKKKLSTGVVMASDRSAHYMLTKNIRIPTFRILKEEEPAVVLTGYGESAILSDYELKIAEFFLQNNIVDCRSFKNKFPLLYRQLAEMSQFYIHLQGKGNAGVIADFLLGISDEKGLGLLYYFMITSQGFSLEELTNVPGFGVTFGGSNEVLMLLEELLKDPYIGEREAIEYAVFILQAVKDITPNMSSQLDVVVLKKGKVGIIPDEELDKMGLKAHVYARWRAIYTMLFDILKEPSIAGNVIEGIKSIGGEQK
ncbi:MAG: hypothetical protein DRG83_05980 [Deltaproteobacteria bacterium]|nr:MAG: hypothetical protein DRG83_05980 [Deltaproteobacteria bacterium]